MPTATTVSTKRDIRAEAAARLAWSSRVGGLHSFASLPTASTAFRSWLATLTLVGIVAILLGIWAETAGVAGSSVAILAGFVLAVAALNYPSSAPRRPKLEVVN